MMNFHQIHSKRVSMCMNVNSITWVRATNNIIVKNKRNILFVSKIDKVVKKADTLLIHDIDIFNHIVSDVSITIGLNRCEHCIVIILTIYNHWTTCCKRLCSTEVVTIYFYKIISIHLKA